jgi:hypothetical protein
LIFRPIVNPFPGKTGLYRDIYPNAAKAGALHSRGGKGEAVALYCESLTTTALECSGFPEGGKTWRKQTWRQEFTGGCISVVA